MVYYLCLFTFVNTMDVSKRISKIINEKKISASKFASTIDVKRSNLSHILSRRNKPSIDFFHKIKKAYPEIDLNWLITGEKLKKDSNFVEPEANNVDSVIVFLNGEYWGIHTVRDYINEDYISYDQNILQNDGLGKILLINLF